MKLIGYVVTVFACAVNWTPSDAMALDCMCDIFPFHIVGVIYRCDGKLISDGQSNDDITAVYGTHADGQRNADVQGVIISSQKMKQFPENIGSFFPNLKLINFPINSISSVTHAHLSPFPKLEFLALYGNDITSIESNLFAGLNSLKFVNLGRNRIKHVGHDIILPSNAHIYLYSNTCIDRDAVTELEMTFLRFGLMMNCPPETDSTAGSTVNRTPKGQIELLKNKYLLLAMRVSFLDALIDSKRCLHIENQSY